jgi:tetratricopeptide (TPR) repeat protein
MASGQPKAGLEAYETSLETWPARYNSLLGAARAARDAGMPEKARECYSKLLTVVGDAETDRSGVREARKHVAARG